MKMTLKEYIEKHSYKYCINRHQAGISYLHPKMYKLSKEAEAKGEEYFYTKLNDKDVELSEPEYMYKIIATLTPEEYEELMNERN